MKKVSFFIILITVVLGFGISNVYAQEEAGKEFKNIAVNSFFKDGLKGWKIVKEGPGDFIVKVEKQGDKNVLHVIRKGSGRKKGYVSIYQEWDPPAQGDSFIISIEAKINSHQLKTSGRWSKKDPKTACYPIHLFMYSPKGCIYDWGLISRDNPPGYPINYLRKDLKTWFFFDSVAVHVKETGIKKAEIRCEGYDFDIEFRSIRFMIGKEFETLKGRGF